MAILLLYARSDSYVILYKYCTCGHWIWRNMTHEVVNVTRGGAECDIDFRVCHIPSYPMATSAIFVLPYRRFYIFFHSKVRELKMRSVDQSVLVKSDKVFVKRGAKWNRLHHLCAWFCLHRAIWSWTAASIESMLNGCDVIRLTWQIIKW